ncbi:MAG: hypothetical protein WBM40_20180 [Thiohalocapsa sp.]
MNPTKMLRPAQLKPYLLRFVGWSLFFAVIYAAIANDYAAAVVRMADLFTNVFTPVTLDPNPRGLVANSPSAKYPMGIPYTLTVIGLNAIFAPALVLTTVRSAVSGALRAALSMIIMVILHAGEVTLIILFHLSHPDNAAVSLGYSDTVVSSIQWVYRFIDRMSYALFPFLAWAIACPDVIAQFFASRAQSEESQE